MKPLLRFLSLVWLGIITPLFGILPLWCFFGHENSSSPVCNIERAFLVTIWSLFFFDPAPNVSDGSIPITEGQAIAYLITIFSVAGISLYYCFQWWTGLDKGDREKEGNNK